MYDIIALIVHPIVVVYGTTGADLFGNPHPPRPHNLQPPVRNMSKPTKYLLVSLPTSISPANDHDEALTALRSAVSTDNGTVFPFEIPEFKIGTLDALVQQADELAKLDPGSETVVAKVGDSLKVILEGDEGKIAQQKNVNDSQSMTAELLSLEADR